MAKERMMNDQEKQERTQRIARRAYQKWEADGFPEGQHTDHWLEAESEGRAEEEAANENSQVRAPQN
jgi:Protein of unknown function (DUF2934)